MADKYINELEEAKAFQDESLLAAWHENGTKKVPGSVIKEYLREVLDEYVHDAGFLLDLGQTHTGEPGSAAKVENTGTAEKPVLEFTLPQGDKGETGQIGPKGDPFTYDDFTPEQLAGLIGPQGPAGPAGGVTSVNGATGDVKLNFIIEGGKDGMESADDHAIHIGLGTSGGLLAHVDNTSFGKFVFETAAGANGLLNALTTGSSAPVDSDYYISQYAGGGTSITTYHRRPVSALWAYMKKKVLDSVYPVGSYYWSNNNVSPGSTLGGSWTQVQDAFVLAAGKTYGVSTAVKGAASHTLTKNEIPSYNLPTPNIDGMDVQLATGNNANTLGLLYEAGRGGGPLTYMLSSGGGGQAFSTMPPYVVAYCWRRTA